jgi:hypothetical protein
MSGGLAVTSRRSAALASALTAMGSQTPCFETMAKVSIHDSQTIGGTIRNRLCPFHGRSA